MEQQTRTYTLDEAARELNLSRETIERVLPLIGGGTHRTGDRLSEDELNQIVDRLNADQNTNAK